MEELKYKLSDFYNIYLKGLAYKLPPRLEGSKLNF